MNPIGFAMRRPMITMTFVVACISGVVLASNKTRVENIPALNTTKAHAYLDDISSRAKRLKEYVVAKYESYFQSHNEEAHHEQHKIVATSPKVMDVTITQQYVCQIHSQRHIDVCALDSGYLEEISVKEGQSVKKEDMMFKIFPVLYQAKLDAELAEARLAELEFKNTSKLLETQVVSANEVLLFEAKMKRAQAKAAQARAEWKFTEIRAPFDGIVDRQREQLGSFIKEGELLTTLSDNSVMWVYFNVPEKQYLEYMAAREVHEKEDKIELLLASQTKFPQPGKVGAIEGQFNNETGNIAFRADFPNPDGLLRHGQTGTILIHRKLHDALVIPMRAAFEIMDKRYVYVIDKDDVARQREIVVQNELEDVFVINKGVEVGDKIVFEGVRQLRDGDKVEFEFRAPEEVMAHQKHHAE